MKQFTLLLPSFFVFMLLLSSCKKKSEGIQQSTYTVHKGEFAITVLENGNLETSVSNDIVQKVGSNVKILEIVEEGTTITPEDVKNKKVLIKFDSKDVEDLVYERTSQHENAVEAHTQAEGNLSIQKSDNDTSIRSAELAVLYAKNDLRKLVGDKLAEKYSEKKPDDIPGILEDPDLGGQVRQDLTNNSSDIELAQIRLNRAEQKLEYTRKLYAKQFVSKNELETDELEVESQKKTLITTKGKYKIYCSYDFITQFYKTWSSVLEAEEKLVRAKAVANSRLVSSEAALRSKKQNLLRSEKRLNEAQEMLDACTVYATAPGLVVYQSPPRWMNSGPIRAGVETRNRQTIIKLPDLHKMTVEINVHEAQIDLIKKEQPAIISVDAIAEKKFIGKVLSRAILPSAQNQWLNPDLKVYKTIIAFDQYFPNLRPGMNATVEIIIEKLKDILFIPCQAVKTDEKNHHYCFKKDGTPVRVELGKNNRIYVEITKGLKQGDKVLLAPPELPKTIGKEKEKQIAPPEDSMPPPPGEI